MITSYDIIGHGGGGRHRDLPPERGGAGEELGRRPRGGHIMSYSILIYYGASHTIHIYIYIYVHIHIHIHVYIYIYTYTPICIIVLYSIHCISVYNIIRCVISYHWRPCRSATARTARTALSTSRR